MKVYFDNASTTKLDLAVFEKMRLSFLDNFGNPNSLHSFGRKALSELDGARDGIAKELNASYKEIYFTSGGTEADNLAIKGVATAQTKKKLLVSAVEHSAVLAAASDLKKQGYVVDYLVPDKQGRITCEELKSKLDDEVFLVSVMLVNNETGVINDVKALAEIAKAKGALFHTDAVQGANYESLDVKEYGVDLMSLSAHKIHGPKGIGLLYVREGVKINSLISGGHQERGVRGGTVDLPLISGFAEALSIARRERALRREKTTAIRDMFEKRLGELEDVTVNFTETRSPSISNVRFNGVNAQALMTALDLEGIAVSIGSACNAGSVLPSHVLKASGLNDDEIASSLRFSFDHENTAEEVDYTIEVLKTKLENMKGKRLFLSMQKDKFLS